MSVQQITVLGATGSIGTSTLDVIARHSDRYQVFALTAHKQLDALAKLCQQFNPRYAVITLPDQAEKLQQQLKDVGCATEILFGAEGLAYVANHPQVDAVMAAIVGAAGLQPTYAAVQAGKKVLLANKESLVMSGKLFIEAAEASGAVILPIDSEHNAIFQCLPYDAPKDLARIGVRRIVLTASGGPFLNKSYDELKSVTPNQACAHPNWSMGKKISVDSATLMNKGLELIEACWLFNVKPSAVEVVVHPQSIIHSMVDYVDGSVLAQLGNPDMRTPIAHAMAWPERIDSGVEPLDFFTLSQLEFYPPDLERFACLRLAIEAMTIGGVAPAVLNAANEIAVEAFLTHKLGFTQIPELIESVLSQHDLSAELQTLDQVFVSDHLARRAANDWLKQYATN